MAEEIVLEKRENGSNGTKPIFLDVEILDKIRELSHETNIPMRRIVEKFVNHGIKNVKIVEGEE